MKLSDGEKLILVMLADIQEKLGLQGEVDPDFVKSAIFDGQLWAFEWQFGGLFHGEETSEDIVKEVADILTMWSAVEFSYGKLNADDRSKIEADVPYYGGHVRFDGFDGNNETEHLGAANFLVEKMGRWSNFKGRSLNSHAHSLSHHRNMLRAFNKMDSGSGALSADQIIELLNATHPSLPPEGA